MPEIKPSMRFIRQMRHLDQLYLGSVNAVLRDFRRVALDILYRDKVRISTIQPIKSELMTVESRTKNISTEISQKIDETVIGYMNLQLGNLRKVHEPRLPYIQQLNLQSYSERRQAYESTLLQTPKWIAELSQNFEINLTRLAVADAPIETAVDRLLANTISDGRASVLRLASAGAATWTKTNSWVAALLATRIMFKHTQQITRTVYMKQAIAAIDQVTTDCCLRVHGQKQPLEKPFVLVGTPRFADEIDSPPFHWNAILSGEKCMTSKGIMPIEDVRIGDYVLTHKNRFMPVTMALSRKHTGRVLEIKTNNGSLRVTPEHPILTTAGWKRAELLGQGDTILGSNKFQNFTLSRVNFIMATKVLQNVIVCDLSVQGDESYCINGHYVHNCRSAMSLYTEKMEEHGITTAEMEAAAQAELQAREETGQREDIWPSYSASGRP